MMRFTRALFNVLVEMMAFFYDDFPKAYWDRFNAQLEQANRDNNKLQSFFINVFIRFFMFLIFLVIEVVFTAALIITAGAIIPLFTLCSLIVGIYYPFVLGNEKYHEGDSFKIGYYTQAPSDYMFFVLRHLHKRLANFYSSIKVGFDGEIADYVFMIASRIIYFFPFVILMAINYTVFGTLYIALFVIALVPWIFEIIIRIMKGNTPNREETTHEDNNDYYEETTPKKKKKRKSKSKRNEI